MTTDEACNELYQKFNLLWNNIASDKAPGLEKYEISVLMTQAQEALVKDYFSARSNALAEGFDDSIRRQSDFRTLHTAKALSLPQISTPEARRNTMSIRTMLSWC